MTTTDHASLDAQLGRVKEQAQEILGQVKDRLEPADRWVRTMAKERPVLLLAGALGVGYLVARLLRSR